MMVTIETTTYGAVIAKDEAQNEMWFYYLDGLTPSTATYKGKTYDYEKTHWKHSKAGKVSKEFANWAVEMHKQAYEAYHS